jgi:hypothetical protein
LIWEHLIRDRSCTNQRGGDESCKRALSGVSIRRRHQTSNDRPTNAITKGLTKRPKYGARANSYAGRKTYLAPTHFSVNELLDSFIRTAGQTAEQGGPNETTAWYPRQRASSNSDNNIFEILETRNLPALISRVIIVGVS